MEMFTFYEVGGKVRDELLGIESKDIDYVAVPTQNIWYSKYDVQDVFKKLEEYLKDVGYYIFLSTPDCFTIRAKFPKDHINKDITADFVLARKEIGYK